VMWPVLKMRVWFKFETTRYFFLAPRRRFPIPFYAWRFELDPHGLPRNVSIASFFT